MTWVAVGVGGAALATGIYSSVSGSAAAGRAARAKAKAAHDWQQKVDSTVNSASSMVGNPAAMAAHDQALQSQERQVQRQEELAKSINPALIEAGKNLKGLLDGSKDTPAMKNLTDQRNLQRQNLISQLHENLGPGAETSSAGQQALQHFDAETSNQMSSAHEQYTQMLLGSSLQAPGAMGAVGAANAQLSEINSQDPSRYKAGLMMQGVGLGNAANESVMNSAGSGQVGQIMQAQGLMGVSQSMGTMAGGMAGKSSLGSSSGTLGSDINKPYSDPSRGDPRTLG